MNAKQMACIQRIDQIRAKIAEQIEGLKQTGNDVKIPVLLLENMDEDMAEAEQVVISAGKRGFEDIPSERLEATLASMEEMLREVNLEV